MVGYTQVTMVIEMTKAFSILLIAVANMIKRGGENVSCIEIENIIASHPKIQDVAVIGVPDDIRDEAIKAFVVLVDGETLSEEAFSPFVNRIWRNLKCLPPLSLNRGYHVIAQAK